MNDCIFCMIARGEIAVEAVAEDDRSVAFADNNPQAPVHLLVVPKAHFARAGEAPAELLGHLLEVTARLGTREAPGGYRVVINTGDDGGQTVNHLHLHVLGGRSMQWPPG